MKHHAPADLTLETALLRAVSEHRPLGVHRHFNMVAVVCELEDHNISAPTAWGMLDKLYDIEGLNALEDVNEPDWLAEYDKRVAAPDAVRSRVVNGADEEEFVLPWSEFEELIAPRRSEDVQDTSNGESDVDSDTSDKPRRSGRQTDRRPAQRKRSQTEGAQDGESRGNKRRRNATEQTQEATRPLTRRQRQKEEENDDEESEEQNASPSQSGGASATATRSSRRSTAGESARGKAARPAPSPAGRRVTVSGHERRGHEWNFTPTDPLDIDARLSFKSYVALQRAIERDSGGASPPHEERMQNYRAYRAAYQQRSLWHFFLEHYEDEWFREKYSPEESYSARRVERRRVGRNGRKEIWLNQLHAGEFDNVCNDLGRGETLYTVVSRFGATEHFDTDVLSIPPDTERQLLVRSWPPELAREQLETYLATFPGFQYVALLEPIAQRRWARAGIAVFVDGTDVRAAVAALDGKRFGEFVLHLSIVERPSTSRLRFAPEVTNSQARLEHDIQRAQALIDVLELQDAQLSIGSAASITDAVDRRVELLRKGDQRSTLKLRLDILLDALRHVYHCDYYLGLITDFPEELERRSVRHVRRQCANADSEECAVNDSWWTEHLDRKVDLLLAPTTQTVVAHGGIDADTERHVLSRPFIRAEDGHARCHVDVGGQPCGKLFSEQVFAERHVVNKHAAALGPAVRRLELADYFNSYLRDPMRVAPNSATDMRRVPEMRGQRAERAVSMPHERQVDKTLLRFGARSTSGGLGPSSVTLKPPLAAYIDATAAEREKGAQRQYKDLDGSAPQREQDLPY